MLPLIRETEQDYYNILDHRKVAVKKWFLKNIRLLFSDKISNFNNAGVEKSDTKKEDDIAHTFNDCFTSVTSKLNILRHQDTFIDSDIELNWEPDSKDNWAI